MDYERGTALEIDVRRGEPLPGRASQDVRGQRMDFVHALQLALAEKMGTVTAVIFSEPATTPETAFVQLELPPRQSVDKTLRAMRRHGFVPSGEPRDLPYYPWEASDASQTAN